MVLDSPRRANAEIAKLRWLVRCVPALNNLIEVIWHFVGCIALKPRFFDRPATKRSWCLLILAREIVFAHGLANAIKRFF